MYISYRLCFVQCHWKQGSSIADLLNLATFQLWLEDTRINWTISPELIRAKLHSLLRPAKGILFSKYDIEWRRRAASKQTLARRLPRGHVIYVAVTVDNRDPQLDAYLQNLVQFFVFLTLYDIKLGVISWNGTEECIKIILINIYQTY